MPGFKFSVGAAALASGLLALSAHAQSTVSIYGVLDLGVTHVDNANGGRQNLLDTGVMQASRLGFRGTEDLGGGRQALFVLEQGIVMDTGTIGQGGIGFGRQSFVGLSDRRLGTVTLGRQYDFMFDSLVAYINPSMSAGGYANNPLDNDRMSGQRVNNAVKYASPKLGGFSFGALVASSEAVNTVRGSGYSRSFGANYVLGDLSLGAAYTYVQGATLETRSLQGSAAPRPVGGGFNEVYGVGGSYKLHEALMLHAVFNNSKYEGSGTGANARFRNYEGGVVYSPAAQWRLGAAVNTTQLYDNDYRQLNLTADYLLSRRTDVYAQVIHQRASGNGATANIFLLAGSSDDRQTALRVGVRHRF